MTAWHSQEVDELPSIEDREPYTTYVLPDGVQWVPNNMGDVGEPTHWMTAEEYWDQWEVDLERRMQESEFPDSSPFPN